jgi:uncharacterized protein YecE (DUF72 family)
MMKMSVSDQLSLFGADDEAPPPVRGVTVTGEQNDLARRLPAGLFMGTSSWSFPGWQGIVFDRETTKTVLARHGLAAYASHPLLRCVGIDRTFYAPLPSEDFSRYEESVPEAFRFVIKAHELLTRARLRAPAPGMRPPRNETFLDARYATQEVVRPILEGLGAKAAVVLFQFPPQSTASLGGAKGFAERLRGFLDKLPQGVLYAVELRNPELLSEAYLRALEETGACHCFNVHPTMPLLEEQVRQTEGASFPATVVRWMLRRNREYGDARDAWAPFDRLAEEDPESRQQIASICRRTISEGKPSYVVVNNKAEGSAPLSVFKLAELVGRL